MKKNHYEIVGSVIADSAHEADARIKKLSNNVQTIQLDIMDGIFVPQKSLLFDIPDYTDRYAVEAHLMMKNPLPWLEKNHAKISTAIIHCESDISVPETIAFLRKCDVTVGLAIGPSSSSKELIPFINHVDMVLVFTADKMGSYGAAFDSKRIEEIKTIFAHAKGSISIEVDGGVSPETIRMLADAGACRFVCGSYLQQNDTHDAIKTLFQKLNNR